MIPLNRHCLLFLFTLLLCGGIGYQAGAQSYVETFGQNRVQKRKFEWKFFDTKHFRVYHYDKAGRTLGRYVAEEAENNIKLIEAKMGGQFPSRFNIVLYNSYDDYVQTNIGLKDESQISEMTISGTWNLVGDKLLVYHTGKHNDLRKQIQSGMARVVMEHMIYGESFKKMARTALLMNLPPWVTEGFIDYLVEGWNAEANSEWKRIMDARPELGFHELSEMYPELAGKAFWKFISDNYGTAKMKGLLSDMQAKTSLNKSMKDKANLGIKVTKAYDSCMVYYKNSYHADSLHQEVPDSTHGLIALKVPKDNSVIRDIKVSPNGRDIAFVAWKNGMYTIYLQKTGGEQVRTELLTGGSKDLAQATDPNYPLTAWSNGGNKMAILYRNGTKNYLRVYNSQKTRIENYVIPNNRFDRVLSMCFMEDDRKLILSAIKKSQTDLYEFTIGKGSKLTNITDDAWDDLDPVFVGNGARRGILFLSNRPKPNMDVPQEVNQLPNGPLNIYFYNATTQRRELLQCTKYREGHVSQPIQYGPDNFAYLYDGNGVVNKYVVMFARDEHNMDTAYSLPVTNYNTSIISHQFNMAVNEVADVIQVKDKYRVYFHGLYMPTDTTPAKVLVPTTLSKERGYRKSVTAGTNPATSTTVESNTTSDIPAEEPESPSLVASGNAFRSEFSDTVSFKPKKKKKLPELFKGGIGNVNPETDSSTLAEINDSAYIKMKPSPYRRSFKAEMFNVRVDNSVLFTQYQPYANNNGQYVNPPISALTTINIGELMEDYKITAGFQLPINLSSSAYFLQYRNTRHQLDWSILGLRTQKKDYEYVLYSTTPNIIKQQLFKNVTNMVQGDVSYPFDKVRRLQLSTAMRQDKLIQKVQDTLSMLYDFPNPTQYWSLSRLEYVFDNTLAPILNIRMGTRYKVYAEYMNELNGEKQSCYNLGFDYRTYTKLYKNCIWALRMAYAHSDGNAMVEYQLGGVDNWVRPQVANDGSTSTNNYGFIAQETSLRGYKQAARKGNNFAVLSTEVRIPVLTTFIKRPIQSAILKNLQLVGFMDMGSAWSGILPSSENLTTTYQYPKPWQQPGNVYMTVTVPNASGLALGYGAGLRTILFGYFARLDFAWNIEGSKKPMAYFGIGTDF